VFTTIASMYPLWQNRNSQGGQQLVLAEGILPTEGIGAVGNRLQLLFEVVIDTER
jgi:hypothetical protein